MPPIDLQSFVSDVINRHPEYSGLRTTVEKELLHYEILSALSSERLLRGLVFQGGTSLRMIYESRRLSEDLDFVGGVDFDYSRLKEIGDCIKSYIGGRYGVRVNVSEPAPGKLDGDGVKVGRWKVSVETRGDNPAEPWQKIKIEVANVPAYTSEPRPLKLNYPEVPGGFGTILVNCESLEEILADKYIALTCRRALKARDIWDIAFLRQRRTPINAKMVADKFSDYRETGEFTERIMQRLAEVPNFINGGDFSAEMGRFLLPQEVSQTLEADGFLSYLTAEIKDAVRELLEKMECKSEPAFKM